MRAISAHPRAAGAAHPGEIGREAPTSPARFVAMLDAAGMQSAPTRAEPVTCKDDMPMGERDQKDATLARATLHDVGLHGETIPVLTDASKPEDVPSDKPLSEKPAAVM